MKVTGLPLPPQAGKSDAVKKRSPRFKGRCKIPRKRFPISKCGSFQHGTLAPIFTDLDTSLFFTIHSSTPSPILSPFSFFSHPQVSYSPQSPHFPLVGGHAISLSSGFLYRNITQRVFSPFDTSRSSLELGWPPRCSFWERANPNHSDRTEGEPGVRHGTRFEPTS